MELRLRCNLEIDVRNLVHKKTVFSFFPNSIFALESNAVVEPAKIHRWFSFVCVSFASWAVKLMLVAKPNEEKEKYYSLRSSSVVQL